jgi:hypothetical protein
MKKIFCLLSVCLLVAGAAQATVYTWNGTTDGNWSNTANWASATIPVDRETDVSVNTSGLSVPYTDSIIFDGIW